MVSVDHAVPGVVVGDPGKLRQVLINLVGNAIKFTQIGEVVVRVTALMKDTETEIKFEIADTGDGIPADKLEVIFQPFEQADTSTSRKYEGAGLGLSISRELVTLMEETVRSRVMWTSEAPSGSRCVVLSLSRLQPSLRSLTPD